MYMKLAQFDTQEMGTVLWPANTVLNLHFFNLHVFNSISVHNFEL